MTCPRCPLERIVRLRPRELKRLWKRNNDWLLFTKRPLAGTVSELIPMTCSVWKPPICGQQAVLVAIPAESLALHLPRQLRPQTAFNHRVDLCDGGETVKRLSFGDQITAVG